MHIIPFHRSSYRNNISIFMYKSKHKRLNRFAYLPKLEVYTQRIVTTFIKTRGVAVQHVKK